MKLSSRKSYILAINLLFCTGFVAQAQETNIAFAQPEAAVYTASSEMGDAVPQTTLLNNTSIASAISNVQLHSQKYIAEIDNRTKPSEFISSPKATTYSTKGKSNLVSGKAFIEIDPILNTKTPKGKYQPIKIFIQAEGDCEGVYVAKRTEKGFVIKEMNEGSSNITFSWRMVANTDTATADGLFL